MDNTSNDDEAHDNDESQKYVQGCVEIPGILDQVNEANYDSGNSGKDTNEST